MHGAVGGTLSAAEGGSFKDGFLGAAVGDACSGYVNSLGKDQAKTVMMMERTAAAGVIGGTVAVMTGGNFVDGAKSAAFAELFNELAHEAQIAVQRIAEDAHSTLSTFTATSPDGKTKTSGYMLEPAGPSTTKAGQDRRIPAGVYDVSSHDGAEWEGVYGVSNDNVSVDRGILIHPGNSYKDTTGCLLPGDSYTTKAGSYYVLHSQSTFQSLKNIIKDNQAILTISDIK